MNPLIVIAAALGLLALVSGVFGFGIWYELRCLRLNRKTLFRKPAEPFKEFKF